MSALSRHRRSVRIAPGRRLGWEIEQLADELTELFRRRVDLVLGEAAGQLSAEVKDRLTS
jgi:hypothetical protein